MISEKEALATVLDRIRPLPSRRVKLTEALDCFAAEELLAPLALPPFDNSAMDGYAVVAASANEGARLRVIGEQPAGLDRRLSVGPGEAIRIFTGAPLPTGADAVVMQEEVTVEGSEIILQARAETGEFVRRRGGDIAEGQRMLARGDRITPQLNALLAAQGVDALTVGGEVRATLLSTGDELVSPGVELQAGQIYDANSALLRALLQKCGVSTVTVSHFPDRAEQIGAAVRSGVSGDAMIITGGVSVGARDFVKEAIVAAGGKLDLWRVAVKPGKPFLFGRAGDCAIFGLPGNPVSAFVTFLLFVRPALLKLRGASERELKLPTMPVRLAVDLQNEGERPHYIRGVATEGEFRPLGRQESHALFGLSGSNALLRMEPSARLVAGTIANAVTWQ